MTSRLILTFRLPDQRYHGRGDGGEPEWPPSPLRAFQSLAAAAFARWRGDAVPDAVDQALRWLERLPAPIILAPDAQPGGRVPVYVPNNDGEIPLKKKAEEGNRSYGALMSEYRTEKLIRPLLLDDETVRFAWKIDGAETACMAETLRQLTRHVTSLGWGIDLAIADADLVDAPTLDGLPGVRWQPVPDSAPASDSSRLRVPIAGTLDDLVQRHSGFLNRLQTVGSGKGSPILIPPPPLTIFAQTRYARAGSVAPSIAVFGLSHPGDGRRAAFSLERANLRLVGMMRDCMRRQAETDGCSGAEIARVILGHGEDRGDPHAPISHLAVLPLPSIEHRGPGRTPALGAIRRIAVSSADPALAPWIAWLQTALHGATLLDERSGEPQAVLMEIPPDSTKSRYTAPASTWATVTPLILPGTEDKANIRQRLARCTDTATQDQLLQKLHSRTDHLIRKAMRHADIPEVFINHARLLWQREPLWHGTPPDIGIPSHARQATRFHVRVQWQDSGGTALTLPGPLCLGRGRFYGVGLFAAED